MHRFLLARILQSACQFVHRLDSWARSSLNFWVRGLWPLVLLLPLTAAAHPRAKLGTFVAEGPEMSYFGPEVARALGAALTGAGVEFGRAAEASITGRVESLDAARVRVSASWRGQTVSDEGPLESIDEVTARLAERLISLLKGETNGPERRSGSRGAHKRTVSAVRLKPSSTAGAEARADIPKRAGARSPMAVERAVAAASTPAGDPTLDPGGEVLMGAAATPPANSEGRAATLAGNGGAATPPVHSAPAANAASRPPPASRADSAPAWSPPRVDDPPGPPGRMPPYLGGFVRGRVVAHEIADPPGGYPRVGGVATRALFAFLHRRLHLSVIASGRGLASVSQATDESYRAAARAVVMARILALEFSPGPRARCQLEVVVVRDGRAVLRRIVESESSPPRRRGDGVDPVFQTVTLALQTIVPELAAALVGGR